MGDWNASNILQNQSRPNFTNLQQPKPTNTKHDPFAGLTNLGANLPQSQPTQRATTPQANVPRATSPYNQPTNGGGYSGVSSSGAWGATFQTRPQAPTNAGGWNPNGKSDFSKINTWFFLKIR